MELEIPDFYPLTTPLVSAVGDVVETTCEISRVDLRRVSYCSEIVGKASLRLGL